MKRLSSLIDSLSAKVIGSLDVTIQDVVIDSRQVKSGALFVALRGAHQDGHRFIPAAVSAGAKAILCEKSVDVQGVTQVVVPDTMRALAGVSAQFWDTPSDKLQMFGITGTNGKTTVSYMLESILQAHGTPAAVLGTINYRYPHRTQSAPNTTPFASELQRFLAQVVSAGVRACVMEVSSHALALGRVEGVDFDVAIFTNLTQDHLDFHKTIEEYGAVKRKLFEQLNPVSKKSFARCAVLNGDDPWAVKLQAVCRVPVKKYALHGPADVTATQVTCDALGSRFDLQVDGHTRLTVHLKLLGDYNVYNALAAATAAMSQGIPDAAILRGLESIPGVPGRMERIDQGQPFTVVVDYAHTEDALRNVLNALRQLHPARILTVFGCGGDRDRVKRPLMGEVAARLSDEVFLTSDNPRSEDPARIALDAEVGIRRIRSDHYQIVLDRAEAIAQSLSKARAGDIVLIAGKGHETYQIMGDKTIPFDDRDVVRHWLRTSSSKCSP